MYLSIFPHRCIFYKSIFYVVHQIYLDFFQSLNIYEAQLKYTFIKVYFMLYKVEVVILL